MLLQKEPCAKQVVVEVEELFLEVETNGEEGSLVVDVGPHNIEGQEEMYTSKPHLIVVANMVMKLYSLLGAHCIRLVVL